MAIDDETWLSKNALGFQTKNDEISLIYIIRLASLLANLRGVAPTWNTYGSQGSDYAYTLPTIEEPEERYSN